MRGRDVRTDNARTDLSAWRNQSSLAVLRRAPDESQLAAQLPNLRRYAPDASIPNTTANHMMLRPAPITCAAYARASIENGSVRGPPTTSPGWRARRQARKRIAAATSRLEPRFNPTSAATRPWAHEEIGTAPATMGSSTPDLAGRLTTDARLQHSQQNAQASGATVLTQSPSA